MKLSNLIAELMDAETRLGDVEVRATWEGIATDIQGIYYGMLSYGTFAGQPSLLLDVDKDQSVDYRKTFEVVRDNSPSTVALEETG